MHEFSIAEALLEQVAQHVPTGAVVRSVEVRAGPLRMIEPGALQWAWQAAIRDTPYGEAKLEFECLPWRLRCPACEREWESDELHTMCDCGHAMPGPYDSDELTLVCLQVDEDTTES